MNRAIRDRGPEPVNPVGSAPVTTSRSVVLRRWLPPLLLLLTVFGPISMDLYLPALPALTVELGASTSVAQLTVTACLIGLAVGQLFGGSVSDQFGRRGVLLAGVGAYIATSALCAVSPSIEVLIAARLVHGLAGGVGVVIAQAAGRDIYAGGELIQFYGRLTVVGAVAAIIGPMAGGLLSAVVDWRGLFVFLAVIGAGILAATLMVFRETLPREQRIRGGVTGAVHGFGVLLLDRVFVGAVLNQGFLWAAVFAYLAGATYILQGLYGLSPQWYAAAFGLNSAGFAFFGWLGGLGARRWSISGTLAVGIVVAGFGAGGLLCAGLTHVPLWVVLASLFSLAAGVAISSPPATTLALAEYPNLAGTASSLLGTVRYGFGGIAAPFVGMAGATSVLPLGIVTVVSTVCSAVVWLLLARPAGSTRRS